jgi:DNA-directed RNA polymerase subunit alpha
MLVIQRPTVEPIDAAQENRQKFTVSPLEPGFGHTIGNSLRRTLLSSIPGAAVTQVRFDDALHEFDTIAGITEDVTDILLNLKDLVLLSHRDEPVELRLDAKGKGEVTGAALASDPDVEVLNPELHIATLNSSAKLGVSITVERGRGYLSADRTSEEPTIGIIPVDAIFSPVRRVTFEVEATRVEQSTAYDALILDIETDGSINPQEALASSGATLRALMQLVEEMSDEPQGLELGETIGVDTGSADLDLPIEDLDLSERPRNCLKRAQVNSVGELLEKSEDDLLAITNFGQKSLDEVIVKLDERGLSLRGAPETVLAE